MAVSLDPSGDVQVSAHSTFERCSAPRGSDRRRHPHRPRRKRGTARRRAARAFVGRGRQRLLHGAARALPATHVRRREWIARRDHRQGHLAADLALGQKILEVDELAERDQRVIEAHPEVSFAAGGRPAREVEAHARGARLREARPRDAGIELPDPVAASARRTWSMRPPPPRRPPATRRAGAGFPDHHTDRLGAIWAQRARGPLEQRHGLDVRGVREHVDRPRAHELVAVLGAQHLHVERERRRIAGDIDDPCGTERARPPERLPREPRARRIDDDDVRLACPLLQLLERLPDVAGEEGGVAMSSARRSRARMRPTPRRSRHPRC